VAEQNPALLTPEYWAAELPGLLLWALEGLARLHTLGRFTGSAAGDELHREHYADSNPFAGFVAETLTTGDGADFTPLAWISASYARWWESSGRKSRPLSDKAIRKHVLAAFPNARPTGTTPERVTGYPRPQRGFWGIVPIGTPKGTPLTGL
jgi:putative DNA primase/helicase